MFTVPYAQSLIKLLLKNIFLHEFDRNMSIH